MTTSGSALQVVCPHCDSINRVLQARIAEGPNCGHCHRGLFVGQPTALDETRFMRHLTRNDLPLLVDFWAAWCGPCKMMAPVFAQAAQRLEPHARLAKVDTEAAPDISARYGMRSIPTLILFRGGQEIARQAGALDLSSLMRWVQGNV